MRQGHGFIKNSKAAQRQITANHRVGSNWVVDKGLQPGEIVVVEGTQKVRPGAPVKPVFVTTDELAAERPGGLAGPESNPVHPARTGG